MKTGLSSYFFAWDWGAVNNKMTGRSVPGIQQSMNKVATAAQLRFDVLRSAALAEEVKARLLKLAGSRATAEGVLVIEARRYRTQEQNRADALARLAALIQKALQEPKARRATRPTRAAQARRVEGKKRRGEVKKLRGKVDGGEG